MKRRTMLVLSGLTAASVAAAGVAYAAASTTEQDVTCHIDASNVLSCPLPPPQTDTVTATTTAPGPTTTVPGPTTTVTVTATPTPTPTSATPTPTPTTTAPAGSGADPSVVTSAGVTSVARTQTINGDYLATTNLSNAVVNGDLYVGPNVTVSNVLVNGELLPGRKPGGNWYNSKTGPQNIVISHVQFTSLFTIGFDTVTLDAVKSVGEADAPDAQIYDYTNNPAKNLIIRNSYFAPPPNATNDSAHIEAIHMGGVSNVSLTNNVFDYRTSDDRTLNNMTAVLNLGGSEITGAFTSKMTLDHNSLYGGGYYSSYLNFDTRTVPSTVTSNAFSSAGDPLFSGVQYPPSQYSSGSLPGGTYRKFTGSGNTLDGAAIVMPGQQ